MDISQRRISYYYEHIRDRLTRTARSDHRGKRTHLRINDIRKNHAKNHTCVPQNRNSAWVLHCWIFLTQAKMFQQLIQIAFQMSRNQEDLQSVSPNFKQNSWMPKVLPDVTIQKRKFGLSLEMKKDIESMFKFISQVDVDYKKSLFTKDDEDANDVLIKKEQSKIIMKSYQYCRSFPKARNYSMNNESEQIIQKESDEPKENKLNMNSSKSVRQQEKVTKKSCFQMREIWINPSTDCVQRQTLKELNLERFLPEWAIFPWKLLKLHHQLWIPDSWDWKTTQRILEQRICSQY